MFALALRCRLAGTIIKCYVSGIVRALVTHPMCDLLRVALVSDLVMDNDPSLVILTGKHEHYNHVLNIILHHLHYISKGKNTVNMKTDENMYFSSIVYNHIAFRLLVLNVCLSDFALNHL